MKKILHIISSTSGDDSYSDKLAQATIAKIQTIHPGATVIKRDLIAEELPHLGAKEINALRTPQEELTTEAKELTRQSDELITELLDVDYVVVGVPVINFAIPSQLKSWIDRIARAGKTFSYTSDGPQGLVQGKKVYVAIASGGIYSEGPMAAYDFIAPYLKGVFGFVGMTDVNILRVEGIGIPDLQKNALEKAISQIVIETQKEVAA